MEKVAKVECKINLKNAVLESVGIIGGFAKFVKKGERVLLKPNFNTDDPFPASTDLEFLKTIVELVYEAGAKEVIVGESSTIYMKTRQVMKNLGVFDLEKLSRPVKILIFEEGQWVRKEIYGAKFQKCVLVPKILDEIDKLILLPCLKTHKMAQFTGAMKLAIGFMKPSQRIRLHLANLQDKIAEINKVIHPDLIIMDARKCFINRGPTEGDVREPNLILASTNRVALDEEGVKIIQGYEGNDLAGINPIKLPQIKRAIELGIK